MESAKIRVSFDSRYGMALRLSATALITLFKTVSERLIFVLSTNRCPSLPVLRLSSEPAKSIKLKILKYKLALQKLL